MPPQEDDNALFPRVARIRQNLQGPPEDRKTPLRSPEEEEDVGDPTAFYDPNADVPLRTYDSPEAEEESLREELSPLKRDKLDEEGVERAMVKAQKRVDDEKEIKGVDFGWPLTGNFAAIPIGTTEVDFKEGRITFGDSTTAEIGKLASFGHDFLRSLLFETKEDVLLRTNTPTQAPTLVAKNSNIRLSDKQFSKIWIEASVVTEVYFLASTSIDPPEKRDLASFAGAGEILIKGYQTLKTTQVNVSTTASKVVSTGLTNRRAILLQNKGAASIYVGDSTVTTANGIEVGSGEVYDDILGEFGDLYAVCAAGTQDVRVFERA